VRSRLPVKTSRAFGSVTTDRLVHDVDLVLGGALPTNHPDFSFWAFRERRDRHETLAGAVPPVDQIITEFARGPNPDFGIAEGPEVIEVVVDRSRFLAGVCEDCQIKPDLGVGFTAEQVKGGALDARTKVQDVVFAHILCRDADIFIGSQIWHQDGSLSEAVVIQNIATKFEILNLCV